MRLRAARLLVWTSLVILLAAPGLAGFPAGARALPLGDGYQVEAAAGQSQQGTVVQDAFDLLMDRFVHPLDSADLLSAAWRSITAEAEVRRVRAPKETPVFSGLRAEDIATFRLAVERYVAATPALPETFLPGHVAIRGMVARASEGHTYFLSPSEYQQRLAWARGDVSYSGIGVTISGPGFTVGGVFEGGPADRAGIRPGDVILGVDGVSLPEGRQSGLERLRGAAGTSVDLLIARTGEREPFHVILVRDVIAIDFVLHHMLDERVGYVALRGFPDFGVVDQVEASIADLRSAGAEALVLDLRGNAGGRIDVGTRLLGDFLPPATTLFQQVDRSGRTQMRSSRGRGLWNAPVALLVDGNTASMGEIFASAMQEHGVGAVLGARTSGAIAGGQLFPLSDGSALQVTVFEILSSSGQTLNGRGILPDETIGVDPTHMTDPAVDRAIALLNEAVQARQTHMDELAPAA